MAASMSPGSDRHRSFQAALHAVADALTAHGFAAHAERHGDQLRIVSEHCPFGGAAIEHPVICAVDRGMVQGHVGALYGQDLLTETALSLPTGGEHCVTSVHGRLAATLRAAGAVRGPVTGGRYLDHASTSPLRPEARDALVAALDAGAATPAASTPRA